jgi:integrase/recombinase XerD
LDQPEEKLFPWSPRRLEYLLEDLSNEAGLTKHLSFDMCRWTCALTDYHAGVEPDQIRQKLGVSKIQCRELFIKLKKLAGENE